MGMLRDSASMIEKDETDLQRNKKLHELEEDLSATFGPQIIARGIMEDMISFIETSLFLDDVENALNVTKQDISEAKDIVQPSHERRFRDLSIEDSEILSDILNGIEISLAEHTKNLKL